MAKTDIDFCGVEALKLRVMAKRRQLNFVEWIKRYCKQKMERIHTDKKSSPQRSRRYIEWK